MKFHVKIGILFLLLMGIFTSCQDSFFEETAIREDNDVSTRATALLENYDYYWGKGKKCPIKKVEDKSFVVYKTNDRMKLSASMSKAKIPLDASRIRKINISGTDLSGDAATLLDGYEWVAIDYNDKEFVGNAEILYSAPYYTSVNGGGSFPLTNIFYVCLKNDGDVVDLQKMAKEYNVGIVGKHQIIPHMYVLTCTNESKGNALDVANAFYESGLFNEAVPEFLSLCLASNDYYYSSQWNLKTTDEFGINYEQAATLMPNSSNIIVAVIDAGVDLSHPDLNLHSFSWDASTLSSPSHTYYEHGTKVAGIISAKTNNSIGIAGITKGVKVMSISIDFSESNTTQTADAAAAIIKAVDMGASVINNSWYMLPPGSYPVIDDAINYAITNGRNGKGCIVVCAMGNEANNSNYATSTFPPANHLPADEVIAVGAIGNNGLKLDDSSYGSPIDIVAPGEDIWTTAYSIYTPPYVKFGQTSAATAHVSAVAAEILTVNNSLDYDQVQYIIKNTAYKLPGYTYTGANGGRNNFVGYGLLDAYAALDMTYSTYSTTQSFSLSGPSSLVVDGTGNASTRIYASPANLNYSYFWTISFDGEYDRYYLWPVGNNNHSPSADISLYLNSGDAGGRVEINCNVYYGATFLGSASKFIYVNNTSY